jgi:deazaflavin-dependent oxidoreductase (nitroreductase family)
MRSYRQTRSFYRLVRRTASTRPMALVFGVIQEPIDRFVFRISRGRGTASSWLAGVQITWLTTTGARTGRPRSLPVLGLPADEGMILIASNFGRSRNPAWYHNLRANPRATVVFRGIRSEVVARELSGAERERGYRLGEEMFPAFTHYRRWAGCRRIPVLSLEPRATP